MKLMPQWFRQDIADEQTFKTISLLSEFEVNTVCQEAKCPNLNYCFKNQKLTFMILGNACARDCGFCAVAKSGSAGLPIDQDEPSRISQLVQRLGLSYVVITSVSRDDLPDGGASQFARTIELIHGVGRHIKIEVLIPDFQGKVSSMECLLNAGPDIVAHNIETVARLYAELRPDAGYRLSLGVLKTIKQLRPEITTKSSLMLGLGESETEVSATMQDLRASCCDILTLGQYLTPGPQYYPVKEFVSIAQFAKYREMGLALGFKAVFSGPKVRSSFHAEELYQELAYA